MSYFLGTTATSGGYSRFFFAFVVRTSVSIPCLAGPASLPFLFVQRGLGAEAGKEKERRDRDLPLFPTPTPRTVYFPDLVDGKIDVVTSLVRTGSLCGIPFSFPMEKVLLDFAEGDCLFSSFLLAVFSPWSPTSFAQIETLSDLSPENNETPLDVGGEDHFTERKLGHTAFFRVAALSNPPFCAVPPLLSPIPRPTTAACVSLFFLSVLFQQRRWE